MPNYAVMVKGHHIKLRVDGALHRFGCFGLRYFRARDRECAARLALAAVTDELQKLSENETDDPFVLAVEQIDEVWMPFRRQQKGFTFLPEDAQANCALFDEDG